MRTGSDDPSLGTRNAVLPGYTDTDQGPNTTGHQVRPRTREEVDTYFNVMQARYTRLMADRLYDQSHPVDEYAPQGSFANSVPAAASVMTLSIQPDYDMPVRYEAVVVLIPAGALTVTLQLGQRLLTLRTQNATADTGQQNPVFYNLEFTGVILNADDPRVLTVAYGAGVAGQVLSMPYVGLSGFALTRGQYS